MNPQLTYAQFVGALCLWREARNRPKEEMKAIWHVINNRVMNTSGNWPNNVPGVVLQYHQFSSFNMDAKPDLGKDLYHCDVNASKWPLPPPTGNQLEWDKFQLCIEVVQEPLLADPTYGATNYEDEPSDQLPLWAHPNKLTAQIGPFRFYKL